MPNRRTMTKEARQAAEYGGSLEGGNFRFGLSLEELETAWRKNPDYTPWRGANGHELKEKNMEPITASLVLQQMAAEAVMVQDACNILGVSRSYAAALPMLRLALEDLRQPNDTDSLAHHPINRLWCSKLHSLAGLGLSDPDRYREAYQTCLELARMVRL